MVHTRVIVEADIGLCYSPDEGVWYLQRFSTDETSQPMVSREALLVAYERGEIDWQE